MIANRSPAPSTLKWLYITIAILVAIFLSIAFLINYRLKPYASNKIRTAVHESTHGLYNVDFKDIHISLFKGAITFDSLSFKPDTSVIQALREKDDAPKHIYQFDIKALAFRNISFWDVYFRKKIDMESVVIYKPQITVTYNNFKTREEEDVKRAAYQQISKFLRSIHVNYLIVNDAELQYVDKSDGPIQTTNFKGLNIKVTEFRLDSASQYDKNNFYYTQNIQLNLKDHKFTTNDGLYTITVADITSSTSGRNLRFNGLTIKPKYPGMEFSRKYKEQHDRYDINCKEIILTDIDFYRLNVYRRLNASSLIISGAEVKIFMNRELPPVTFDKGRNYPHMILRRLKLKTTIDTVLMKNMSISYSEYNPMSQKKGTVSFNRFNALIRNVSNDSVGLSANHWLRAAVSTWIMNKGKMNVNINMNLIAKNADFNFNGSMGRMDMRELNSLSRNMSLAEIESGTINKAEFKVSGNLRTTSGYLKLHYTNLKVNVLKGDEDSGELEKRGLISAIANSIVIKNDNPDKDGKLRIGKADAERINSASFFNLMWKSIFSGLKESVGFTLGSPEKLQVIKPVTKQEQRKADREQRREERKAKRKN
ncbi:MAG: hypothetical protein WKF68_05295 [Daejeonella sp.]